MHATTGPGRERLNAARVSVVVGLGMLGIKLGAYLLTGSHAILSDALESVVHVGAVLFMYWCVRVASRPPDQDHPYGHGKVEYFSVGFEGGMVVLAALAVFWEAGRGWLLGHEVRDLETGLWLTAAAAAINLALGWWLVRVGRRNGSVIIVADGRHVLSDVYTSVGALVGVAAVRLTGLAVIDSVTAIALGLLILVTGIRLMREAVSGLMDEVDRSTLEVVVAAINEIRDREWLDVHNLRLRSSGDFIYVDFHLMVPEAWTVGRAHAAVERLEHHILARLRRQGAVMIHLDHPKDAAPPAEAPHPLTVDEATRMKPAMG